ncbi:MAG: TolC family protein, partial [Bdellovibrionales bacterium]|nr:TolC family protein [Bdellovibrionales bacterium]
EDMALDLLPPQKEETLKGEIQNRPDVELAKQKVLMAELEKKINLGEHYPSLSLQGSWGYQAKEQEDLLESRSSNHTVSLNLRIPLFSGLTSLAKRRADEAKILAAKMNLRHLQDQSTMEIKNTEQKFNQAQLVLFANKKWSQEAQKAINKGLRSYKLGVISSFQVVQLQKGYEGAAMSYWQSLQSYYKEKMAWVVARGIPLKQFF